MAFYEEYLLSVPLLEQHKLSKKKQDTKELKKKKEKKTTKQDGIVAIGKQIEQNVSLQNSNNCKQYL